MNRNDNKTSSLLDLLHKEEIVRSNHDISEDISLLFTTSDSITPSFNPTMLEYISSDSQIYNGRELTYDEWKLQECLDILDENFKSNISNDIELYKALLDEPYNVTIEDNIEEVNVVPQENKSNQISTNYNNKIDRCKVCQKSQVDRFHTCKDCLDGYGLKEKSNCRDVMHKKVEKCYDRSAYVTKRNPRCKKIKYRYCKCKVNVPFGLCLVGFLFVVIGTGIFGGCWVYLAYASINICNRSTYLHFFWYYIYAITIFMFIFTIIVIILMTNSASRHSLCSVITNPGAGKNCSIIILIMMVVQCFIWMFLFTVVFYVGTEIYLLKNDSKALCGVIDMTLNYTDIYIVHEHLTKNTLILIFISVLGATTVIIGLMLIIIGVSMNYQKMKSALSKWPALEKDAK